MCRQQQTIPGSSGAKVPRGLPLPLPKCVAHRCPRLPSLRRVPTKQNTHLDFIFQALHVILFDLEFLLPKLFFVLQFLVVRVYQSHAV